MIIFVSITAGVNDSYALLWCSYYVDFNPKDYEAGALPFDPSDGWHNYKIYIDVTPADATRVRESSAVSLKSKYRSYIVS